MSGATSNSSPSAGIPVQNTRISGIGPKVVPWNGTFPGTTNFSYFVDLTQLVNQAIIDFVQTIWVDNSQNDDAVTIESMATGQSQTVPPNAQAYLPIFASSTQPQFTVTSSGAANVEIIFANFGLPAVAYGVNSILGGAFKFNSSGCLETSDVVLDGIVTNGGLNINTSYSETDISFTTTGASQVISAANAARQYFFVQCPASLTTGLWINKAGGTAGPNLTGCFFLSAGQTYETNYKAPVNQISVYGASGTLCPAGVG
jgi:hypothetical protein